MATDEAVKTKADYLINLHKPLSENDAKYYALVFCDNVLHNNPTLSNEKRELYADVIKYLEAI